MNIKLLSRQQLEYRYRMKFKYDIYYTLRHNMSIRYWNAHWNKYEMKFEYWNKY